MANIKITVEGPLMDGHKITFKAPCNCDVVEKLDVRYIENNTQKSILFTMKDSHGNDLTGLGNLFFKDAYVDVVLDPNSGSAYLQNAGTNAYIEEKFKTAVSVTPVDNLESDRADLPLSARQGKILNDSLGTIFDNNDTHTFANYVDLASYISSTGEKFYTIPSYGYIEVVGTTSGIGTAQIAKPDLSVAMAITAPTNGYNAIPVYKGMVARALTGSRFRFYPLT